MNLYKNKTLEQDFSNFYVDNNNRITFEVIKSIADCKETGYSQCSPIIVVGKSGTGKTHLMKALENQMKDKVDIINISSEQLIIEIIGTLENKTTNCLYKKYSKANIFIIEDVQFLTNKKLIQKTFLNLMKKLENNTTILLTVGMELKQIKYLDLVHEIITNFENAIILDIVESISKENRYKIIEELKKEHNVNIDEMERKNLIKECNSIVELRNRLNTIKLLENINGG